MVCRLIAEAAAADAEQKGLKRSKEKGRAFWTLETAQPEGLSTIRRQHKILEELSKDWFVQVWDGE